MGRGHDRRPASRHAALLGVFPSAKAGAEPLALKLDVTYLPVSPPTRRVLLNASAIYAPTSAADAVETLTPEAFIADKLPTLGFDTLGYPRAAAMDRWGHPEHIWKQLHDLSGLVALDPDFAEVTELYGASIGARNTVLRRQHTVTACLDDAWRVCSVALAAWAYPQNDDVPGDANFASDVQHVRAGLGSFQAYSLRAVSPALVATRVGLLVRGLRALSSGALTSEQLRSVVRHASEWGASFSTAAKPTQQALRATFARQASPEGWTVPVRSQRVFGNQPEAAIAAYVACRLVDEASALEATGRFTFEVA